MQIRYPDEICELLYEVTPYLVFKGGIQETAPEEIKNKHRHLMSLIKEYEKKHNINWLLTKEKSIDV